MTVLRDQACKCVSLSRDYIQRRYRRRRPRRPSQMISKSIDSSRRYIYKSRATRVFATGLSTSKSHQSHQPIPSTPLFFDPYYSRAFQATTSRSKQPQSSYKMHFLSIISSLLLLGITANAAPTPNADAAPCGKRDAAAQPDADADAMRWCPV